MKAIIQRVTSASVDIDNKEIASINNGMLILLGIHKNDTEKESNYIIKKLINLRIFSDENNLMNKSIVEVGGEILIVSQFTLYGSVKKGNRPSFTETMPPKEAEEFYNKFIKQLKANFPTKTGKFGAYMKVKLVNDGPITILIDS
ncbi:D-tyrosyl-tRNA(Tyr) deacylase [Candidatus Babeliales bacterium]|nr:D-tyrosyl-tRNA(Tyr) deacylase [Candidatus Babeliales bacterium]